MLWLSKSPPGRGSSVAGSVIVRRVARRVASREALLDGRFGHAHTAHSELREWMYERKKQDERLRAPKLAEEIEKKFGVVLSAGHINYLLRKRALTAPPGRPYKRPPDEQGEEVPPTTTESLDNAGTFFPGSSQGRDGGPSDD